MYQLLSGPNNRCLNLSRTAAQIKSTLNVDVKQQENPALPADGIDTSPIDPVYDSKKLQSFLGSRPAKAELVDQNILKQSKLDPSLQAKEAELARSKLEDQLDNALAARPSPQQVVAEVRFFVSFRNSSDWTFPGKAQA